MVNKEKKLVPRLRFEEFEYNNHWIQKMVGEYYTFKNGLNKGKKYFGHGIPIVNYMDVFKTRRLYTENLKGRVNVSQSEQKNYSVLKGDIFFTRTSETLEEIGYPSVMLDSPEKAVFSGFVLRARPKRIDPLDIDFKSYVFYTKSFRNEMIKTSSMSTRALTSGTAIKKMKFKFPENMDEQKQIGNFFKKIDQMIQLQQSKVNKVKDIKSAYLSEMFPKEGEKYPKKRFEGFTDPWKTIKMREVFSTVLSGNRLPKTSLKGGNIPYILATTENNGVYARIDKETRDYHGNKMKIFNTPSISFSIDNPEAIFLQEENYFTSNIMRVLINDDLEKEEYIFFVETLRKATGGFNWGVKFSGPVVLDLDINVPFNKMEDKIDNQEIKKIGLFINELDEAEKLEKSKLEKLEKLKQAYLNDMFV